MSCETASHVHVCYVQNIRKIQLTESKIYALSASGRVYVLPSAPSEQRPGPTSTSTSWWGPFSGDDRSAEFAEVVPREKLGWGERYACQLPLLSHPS